uniref:Uncharacterized protein n=1 Tax=Romanomermis culicivorax TaxID=13658 RepID=A0A915JXK8_ROMCU
MSLRSNVRALLSRDLMSRVHLKITHRKVGMLFTKISFIFAVFSSGMMVTSTLMSADWHKNEGKSLYDARKEEILLKLQHLIDTVDKVEGGLADLINRADIFDEISGTDQAEFFNLYRELISVFNDNFCMWFFKMINSRKKLVFLCRSSDISRTLIQNELHSDDLAEKED